MRHIPANMRFISNQMKRKIFDVFSCRRLSVFVTLLAILAAVGCGNLLNQDSEALDKNERIAALVKVALAQEPGLDAAPIDIKAQNGVVTLGGFVESASNRQQASKAASRVAGVLSVINDIHIK